jgi:hypothetical protein
VWQIPVNKKILLRAIAYIRGVGIGDGSDVGWIYRLKSGINSHGMQTFFSWRVL